MENITQLGSVDTQIEKGIATITFFHPAHNSLPGKLLAQLAHAITAAGENDEVQVVVLKSGGDRTFCAGASFDELVAIDNLDTGKQFFMGFANVINACRKCPKFIIGRVQGKAVGGGIGVAAATDYCLATRHSSIRLSELAVGIGPFVVGPSVARKVGTSAFIQLSVNPGRWFTPEWAMEKGLFADILEEAGELDEAVSILANELTKYNPEAMRLMKKVFWEGTENWDELLAERAAMSGKLVLSDFTRNAIQKFKASRKK
jgi:methylglutaconyl-CoA hydratase